MRTDINKINEHTPHTGLTEECRYLLQEHPNISKPVSGETIHQFI